MIDLYEDNTSGQRFHTHRHSLAKMNKTPSPPRAFTLLLRGLVGLGQIRGAGRILSHISPPLLQDPNPVPSRLSLVLRIRVRRRAEMRAHQGEQSRAEQSRAEQTQRGETNMICRLNLKRQTIYRALPL